MWDEITHPFPNFNRGLGMDKLSHPFCIMDVITYPFHRPSVDDVKYKRISGFLRYKYGAIRVGQEIICKCDLRWNMEFRHFDAISSMAAPEVVKTSWRLCDIVTHRGIGSIGHGNLGWWLSWDRKEYKGDTIYALSTGVDRLKSCRWLSTRLQ